MEYTTTLSEPLRPAKTQNRLCRQYDVDELALAHDSAKHEEHKILRRMLTLWGYCLILPEILL